MARKRKGKAVKKNAHLSGSTFEEEEVARAPHSFVVPLGKTSKSVKELCTDFRKVMEPFTASKIKARPKNVIKDYVHVAGSLNVSHITAFTKTDLGPYLKVSRLPRGPTLTFRVDKYTLARDVRSNLKRQITYEKQFLHSPLLIMNGFGGETRELQLQSSMFQNMFPSINVSKVKLNTIRRCVLISRDQETGDVELRHYTIKVVPVGLTKGIKKLVTGKVPNLGRYDDYNEFLEGRGAMTSESEGEEDDSSKVTLPQNVSARGNLPAQLSSIRLVELGPRITMKLVKIEEGLFDGEVLYHSYIQKTEEEKKAIRVAREKKKKEKERRKKEQDVNVKKKVQAKEDHKQKSLAGMKHLKVNKEDLPPSFQGMEAEKEVSDDDDEEYYRQAVGEDPDKDLFDGKRKRGSSSSRGDVRFKKKRTNSYTSRGDTRGGGRGMTRGGGRGMARGGRGESRGESTTRGGRGMTRGGRGMARGGRGESRGGSKFKMTMNRGGKQRPSFSTNKRGTKVARGHRKR